MESKVADKGCNRHGRRNQRTTYATSIAINEKRISI